MATQDDGFSSKNWVWVPDEKNFYLKGYISDYLPEGNCNVVVVDGGKEDSRVVPSEVLENCNPLKFNKCDDMAELTHLNEPSVVYNLHLRYSDDLIYTYSGLFLVAINPYKTLPIYESSDFHKYRLDASERAPPHIYAIAEGTYRNLLKNKKDQSILVTGESGAGKTENTKYIIQYLSAIITDCNDISKPSSIDARILEANPILESFGNAKTIKNNNSSRFGKFIKIYFSKMGNITGANIEYYLLEKSRVAHQWKGETNYHVFYQLLKGQDGELLKRLHLSDEIKDFKYLTDGMIPSNDYKNDYHHLLRSFQIMGFHETEVENIFAILASILHLGNLDFKSWKSEQASFTDESPISSICSLLGFNETKFVENLLRPKVKAGREYINVSKKPAEVKHAVDAFSKFLYERIFRYLIERVNHSLSSELRKDVDNFIGVLDIAGFEIFEKNSFEQLCINFTNEKLQQFFNHHSFILEQSEYLREDIKWEFIDFGHDLQPTIDLIESKRPLGILEILNEECKIPKATDQTFLEKLSYNWGNGQSKKFRLDKLKRGFIIEHYAGPVEYDVNQWLQKNTDPVNENLIHDLGESKDEFVRSLFSENEYSSENSVNHKSRIRNASQKHKEQLTDLMNELSSTEPHFVRCILPNLQKKPSRLDKELVLGQLRCNGVLEGIRITRAGYPNRMTFEDFCQRYSILNKDIPTKSIRTNSELILKSTDLNTDGYKVGITKIFFKNGILGKLEEMRDLCLKGVFTELQGIMRGNSARKKIHAQIAELRASRLIASTFKSFTDARKENPWFALFVKLRPLLDESIEFLDSKTLTDDLKKSQDKLKELEKLKSDSESEKLIMEGQIDSLKKNLQHLNSELESKENIVQSLKLDAASFAEKNHESSLKIKILEEEKSSLIDEIQSLEQKISEHDFINSKYEAKISTLEETCRKNVRKIEELEEKIFNINEEKALLEKDCRENNLDHKSKLDLLRNENKQFIDLRDELQKKLDESMIIRNDLMTESTMIKRKHDMAADSIIKLETDLAQKELTINSLQARIKQIESSTMELQKSSNEDSEKYKLLYKRTVQLQDENDRLVSFKNEADVGSSSLKREIDSLKVKEASHLGEISNLKAIEAQSKSLNAELGIVRLERDNAIKKIEQLEIEVNSATASNKEYSQMILDLKGEVAELEDKLRAKEREKENIPPIAYSLKDEYNSIKLKLNEHTASLRKEKFENKKLQEELDMIKSRRSPERPESASILRKSMDGNDTSILKLSVDSLKLEMDQLKFRLEQEEANSQRAENYAVELQKKLNKLQASRGLNTSIDYESMFKQSQNRVSELEKKFAEYVSKGDVVTQHEVRSDYTDIPVPSTIKNQDILKIYQDVTNTLKVTRSELSVSKSEILRLKHLLRESEDELYNTKRETFKHSAIDFENEVAELKVRNSTLSSKNSEITKDLQTYKSRSEKYFEKLELAESAVKTAKRRELSALNELKETNMQLVLARDEARASQIMVKEITKEKEHLQSEINSLEFLKTQLEGKISELKDKNSYYEKNYNNRELNDSLKDEIAQLHKDLDFKLKSEISLIRENKQYKLDYEDVLHQRQELESDLKEVVDKLNTLEKQYASVQENGRVLADENAINMRKVSNLAKQLASHKDLIDQVTEERNSYSAENSSLKRELAALNEQIQSLKDDITQNEKDMELLRQHLQNQRDEKEDLRSELSTVRSQTLSSIEDYQKVKRDQLLVVEENDSLKKVNQELIKKAQVLEDKLYSNEQLRYWEEKVSNLNTELENAHVENFNLNQTLKNLKRESDNYKIKADNDTQLIKKYNDENFEYKNRASQLKSTLDVLHNDISDKDLQIRSLERENEHLKGNLLQLERDILESRNNK